LGRKLRLEQKEKETKLGRIKSETAKGKTIRIT
jgi:hypothetical protein